MASVKSIIVGAAPFAKAIACKFHEKAPHVIFKEGMFQHYFNILRQHKTNSEICFDTEMYIFFKYPAWGMTELSPLAIVTPENIAKIGSCGVLLPNTKGKIVDLETGDALGPHKKGELCIKGPQVKL